MPFENSYLIKDLYPNYPFDGDLVNQGDDHIRNIKKSLVNSFPNIDEPLTFNIDYLSSMKNKMVIDTNQNVTINSPYYRRTNKPDSLHELYITKDQNVLTREPMPPIGTIIENYLTLNEINTANPAKTIGKPRFAVLNGDTITGSLLNTLTGITSITLPNAYTKKAFLAAPKDGEVVGTFYPYSTNSSKIKIAITDNVHGDADHGDTTHTHNYVVDSNNNCGVDRDGDNTNTPSQKCAWEVGRSTNSQSLSSTEAKLTWHTITTTWSPETAPISTQVNYFIRIN